MIYLKTIIYVLLLVSIFNSPLFVSYYNIKYFNLVFIYLPIIGIISSYFFFKVIGIRRFNPQVVRFKLNSNLALIIATFCVILVLQKFDINKFISADITDVRDNFTQFEVSIVEQLLPILLVYPLACILRWFALPKVKRDWRFYAIIICLLIYGISSGGRGFIFFFVLSYLFIASPKLLTYRTLLFIISFVSLFVFITLGRVSKDLEFDSARYFESSGPLVFNQWLKHESVGSDVRNFIVPTLFYFGHSVPAFCNKIENLEFTIIPKSVLGLQPFVERQLIRVGVLRHDQGKRYSELIGLANGSGFFEVSWSTTFLDVYFHEGVIFSGVFFLFVAFIFYQSNLNLVKLRTVKFKVITGLNVIFIITFFLSPIFMDTTWFLVYLLFWFSSDYKVIAF